MNCQCVGIELIGLCEPEKIKIHEHNNTWTEVSIPEVLTLPCEKPDIETIDKVFLSVKIISKRVIKTAKACHENPEGTNLTGRKLIIEGVLQQKIVYTAKVLQQSVHSAHFEVPFSAFIILKPCADPDENFCINVCVEDVFVMPFSCREVFKNVTLFLQAEKAS